MVVAGGVVPAARCAERHRPRRLDPADDGVDQTVHIGSTVTPEVRGVLELHRGDVLFVGLGVDHDDPVGGVTEPLRREVGAGELPLAGVAGRITP